MLSASHNRRMPSPIYSKALEIFTISRHISYYMTDELAVLREDGQEDPAIYFGGDIVQQSINLAPEILKAENEPFSDNKYKHAASVNRLIERLNRSCERLEKVSSNGRDFLPILKKEINKFRKLQRTWMLTF